MESESKKYIVILHLDIDEGERSPAKWDWPALIGQEVFNWTVYDVTDENDLPIRVLLNADDVEEV